MTWHSLLTRQLRRHKISADAITEDWLQFVSSVNDAYRDWDEGRALTERSLELSSQELRELNGALEQRVKERTAELEAVNRELETFAYSVSHDLRQPLRSLGGFSTMLLQTHSEQLDKEGQDLLRRMSAASKRMSVLIDALLGLSQLTRQEIHREPIHLSRMVRAIGRQLASAEPERAVCFQVQDGLTAEGDPHLVRIAMGNLLSNAWKFSRPRVRAEVEFGQDAASGAYYVRDNGVGFDMAYSDKLFQAFERLHSHDFDGHGIGLVTVYRVIQRHGGWIRAEAIPDGGATFYFTLTRA